MNIMKLFVVWKYPLILLVGIGVSSMGAWVYLIALNLTVLNMTQSPFAVAFLYILHPLSAVFTNLWSGSLTDRLNKRNLMAFLDVIRAIFITVLPLFSSIWWVYAIVFFINMGSSIFAPASLTYITKLIPVEQRQRFNALNSLITSGAFLLGPAVAGMLLLVGSPTFAIYMNAIALFISGMLTFMMPDVEKHMLRNRLDHAMSWRLLKKDGRIVLQFYRHRFYVMLVCLVFGGAMVVMTSAVDSLEATFAKFVLNLSDSDYGILVSMAGVGIIAGAIINTFIVKKVRYSIMIGAGAIGVCLGYFIYAFSHSFLMAAIGFLVLAFFLAFVNTGFTTFFQNHVPVDVMGRVSSLNQFFEAIFKIIATMTLGLAAQIISIRIAVVGGVFVMLLLAIMLCICTRQPSKTTYYYLRLLASEHNIKDRQESSP